MLFPKYLKRPLSSESHGTSCTTAMQQRALQRFGRQSSAYFAFQPDVLCFAGSSGGLLHYGQQSTPLGPVNLVFTNPLACQTDMADLIAEFEAHTSHPCVYLAVDRDVASVLRDRDYRINQIGAESKIDLNTFDLRGRAKKQLRHASHFGERHGCEVRELNWHEVDAAEVHAVSESWLSHKNVKHRELRYVTRPPVFGEEWGVRKFYCYQGNRLLGFVFFDPYYSQGRLQGYCANILRAMPEKSTNGVLDFIILSAMDVFRAEGVSELSLGIAPLQAIEAEPGERSVVRIISQLFYEYGNGMYAFKGLAYHKTRYRPTLTPWYLCSKNISLLRLYWAMLFGLRVLGRAER